MWISLGGEISRQRNCFRLWWRRSEEMSLSRVRLFATPWTVAHQAPGSMGFSRHEYWSGLPFPFPGDLPNPGIEPVSPALLADALPSKLPGKQEVERTCKIMNFLEKSSWTIKKAECQRINAFELWCWRRLLSPLDCKEIQPVHPKGDQSWIFIGRTDAAAETPILWPPDVKNWLTGKDPDAGKDWRQEKGTTEDEMVGWHHWLDGNEFEQALGVGDGQRSLACCSPWGHKESDTTEQLSWTGLQGDQISQA